MVVSQDQGGQLPWKSLWWGLLLLRRFSFQRRGPSSHVRTFLAGRVRVLDRVLPAASTQTYSARMVSAGKGSALYRSTTAGSSCERPVLVSRMELAAWRADAGLAEGDTGEKATAAAKRESATTNFILTAVSRCITLYPMVRRNCERGAKHRRKDTFWAIGWLRMLGSPKRDSIDEFEETAPDTHALSHHSTIRTGIRNDNQQ